MVPSSLLLLLAAVSSVHCSVEHTQPNSLSVKPGETLTISCAISGYSLTDSSYAVAWIRQSAGKPMECFFYIWGGVTLIGQSLQTEDTANDALCLTWMSLKISVLFFSSHYSFSKFPTVSLLSAPIGTTQYLMCSIEDLAPNKVTVTGKQNDMQVEGLTHTVGKQPSGLYSASSLLKVTNTDWNNKVKYSCVVQHTEQTITKTISKTGLYIGEDCTIIYVMLTYRISII
uniref:Ig-like domain-containing protein n=1 Tax=Hucho hucho TaxID=62062 RepID=A0A4W5KG90_9TELE